VQKFAQKQAKIVHFAIYFGLTEARFGQVNHDMPALVEVLRAWFNEIRQWPPDRMNYSLDGWSSLAIRSQVLTTTTFSLDRQLQPAPHTTPSRTLRRKPIPPLCLIDNVPSKNLTDFSVGVWYVFNAIPISPWNLPRAGDVAYLIPHPLSSSPSPAQNPPHPGPHAQWQFPSASSTLSSSQPQRTPRSESGHGSAGAMSPTTRTASMGPSASPLPPTSQAIATPPPRGPTSWHSLSALTCSRQEKFSATFWQDPAVSQDRESRGFSGGTCMDWNDSRISDARISTLVSTCETCSFAGEPGNIHGFHDAIVSIRTTVASSASGAPSEN
jgi:hypothetical protein